MVRQAANEDEDCMGRDDCRVGHVRASVGPKGEGGGGAIGGYESIS